MSKRLRFTKPSFCRVPILAAAASLIGCYAYSQTTWDAGGGADTNLTTATNWNNDLAPSFNGSESLTFATSGTVAMVSSTASLQKMTFSASTFTMADGGGTLILRGTNSGANTSANLQTNSAATSIAINAPLQILANTGTNLLTINVNRAVAGSTALRINNGISLAAGGSASSYEIRYSNGSGGLADARIAGTISGLGTLSNGGGTPWAGTLLIAGNQSQTSTSSISILGSSGYAVPSSTAKLALGESGSDVQTWNNLTLNSTMNVAVSGSVTFLGTISGTGAAKLTSTNGATVMFDSSSSSSPASIIIGGAGGSEANLNIAKAGSGSLTLSTTNTYTGSTTVSGSALGQGWIRLGIDSAGSVGAITASPIGSGTLVFNGGKVSSVGSATRSIYNPIRFTGDAQLGDGTDFGVMTFAASADLGGGSRTITVRGTQNLNGSVSNGGIVKEGVGTLVLGGSNSYAGTTTINAGILQLANSDAAQNSTVSIGGGSLQFTTGLAGNAATIGALSGTGGLSIQNTSAVAIALTVGKNGESTNYSGALTGGGSLTKTGTGTLTLTGTSNTFAGAVAVNGGVLSFGTGVLSASKTYNLGGGTLRYTGTTNYASDSITLNVPSSSTFDISSALATVRAGTFTGSGDLAVTGNGTLALGRNTSTPTFGTAYTGNIAVQGGATLSLRNENSMGDTSGTTSIGDGSSLLLDPFGQPAGVTYAAETIGFSGGSYIVNRNQLSSGTLRNALTGAMSVSGTLRVTTANVNVGTTQTILDLNGGIGGAGSLIVGGTIAGSFPGVAGRYNLNGTNSYLGDTSVQSGTLIVGGTASTSNFTIASGAVIGGTGRIGGNLTIDAGADFSLDVSGPLTVGGNLSFGGFGISNVSGLTASVSEGAYALFNCLGTLDTTNVTNIGLGNAFDLGSGKSAYFEAGTLQLMVVPEPTTIGLLGLAFATAMVRRRVSRS